MCTSTIDTIRCTVLKLGHKPAGFNLPCTLLIKQSRVSYFRLGIFGTYRSNLCLVKKCEFLLSNFVSKRSKALFFVRATKKYFDNLFSLRFKQMT